jgi:hypothetical protein
MPIQIRELIVSATVEELNSQSISTNTVQDAQERERAASKAMVQACVDEVMRVIKKQSRR